MADDPYVYPGTNVLRYKLDERDCGELEKARRNGRGARGPKWRPEEKTLYQGHARIKALINDPEITRLNSQSVSNLPLYVM
jgi:hypothetical protein